MKEKYYTPEIEEFYVGFEFEELYNDKWEKQVYISGYFLYYDMSCTFGEKKEGIRVKCLDREDIESLGFDNYIPPREYDHTWHYNGSRDPKIKVWFNNEFPTVRIYSSYPAIQFQGTIKNKSELKKLLKQLGI